MRYQSVGVSCRYATFDFERNERNEQIFGINNQDNIINRKSINQNDIRIYTFQADYKKVFNQKWNAEHGLKNAYVTNSSFLTFEGENLDGIYYEIPEFLFLCDSNKIWPLMRKI